MFSSKLEDKHWLAVTIRFITDAALFTLSFIFAIEIRFSGNFTPEYMKYIYGIILSSFLLSSLIYISGYYSAPHKKSSQLDRAITIFFLHVISTSVMTMIYHLTLISVMGRGVFLIGSFISYFSILIHNYILYTWYKKEDKAAIIISCSEGEIDLKNLLKNNEHTIEIAGIITHNDYQPGIEYPVLGSSKDIIKITENHKLDRIITTNRNISDSSLYKNFCKLRYMGIAVVPEISIYEEFYQFCPITKITAEWLLNASASPKLFYIQKLKRGFDIFIALTGIIILSPLFATAFLLVKITSKGPAIYSQKRLGKFGKEFNVIKFRTMKIDAEKDGVQWSKKDDPRVTFIGSFFRKYRIDEIPQLINILKGEMSFVGPRPERPEFYMMLDKEIPFFRERILIHPGLTGWAQVNYPYGNNIQDAMRKLEYDLYYLKHLNIFFDIFIILDTFRIIINGGNINPVELFMDTYENN